MALSDLPPAVPVVKVSPPKGIKETPGNEQTQVSFSPSSLPEDETNIHDPQPEITLTSPLLPEFTLPVPKIPDIIPRVLPASQVHLLSGASGAGKTALTFQLLSALFTGAPFFSLSGRKPSFLGYVAADRTWESHAIWLATVGLTDLPHYSLIQDSTTSGHAIRKNKFGDRFQLFRRCVAQLCISEGLAPKGSSVDNALLTLPEDSFLVVDPISLFIGGDLNKYDTVYSHMLDLNQFCIRYSCTILGIAHAGKQKSDPAQRYTRPQDRIVGTTAQTGCAGTVFHLSPSSETGEEWSEFAYVPHHAPPGEVRLTRDNRGLFVPISPAIPSADDTKKKLRHTEKAAQAILPHLPEDFSPVHYKVILESSSSLSQAQCYRYLSVLEESGEIERAAGSPGNWKRKQKN